MDLSDLSDEELLGRARDESAVYAEFYLRHVSKVTTFAVRRCSSPDQVADLVAAVWLEVIEASHRYDPAKGHPVPWLLGIAANLAASDARRRRREQEVARRLGGQKVLDDDDYAALESQLDAVSIASELRKAIKTLPTGERAVTELVVLDGLTPKRASEALGISGATARMRLTRARSKLRQTIPSFRDAVTSLPLVNAKETAR